MGKVHILQLKCPANHALMAGAYVQALGASGKARLAIEEKLDKLGGERKCGLCGSEELRYHEAPTRFDSLDEAMPALKQLEIANVATRAFFDQQKELGKN